MKGQGNVTRRTMNLDQYIEVLQALKEGKEIEVKCIDHEMSLFKRGWHNPLKHTGKRLSFKDIVGAHASWNPRCFIYRVKPEPQYRPYDSITEFLTGLKKHGPGFKLQGADILYPSEIQDNKLKILSEDITYEQLLETYLWEDGAICGIQLEE